AAYRLGIILGRHGRVARAGRRRPGMAHRSEDLAAARTECQGKAARPEYRLTQRCRDLALVHGVGHPMEARAAAPAGAHLAARRHFGPRSMPPEVTVIRDPARLSTLDGEWDELLARSASDTVFLTWDWLRTWYEVYGAEVEPCVVLVRDGGRLVAAAPLKIEERRRYGLRVRQLEFIGTGRAVCPDFLDFVIEAGREAELVRLLLGALRTEPGWDRIALSDLPATSPVRAPLETAMTAAHLRPFRQVDRTCPYLTLPGTWAELEQRLTHNFRRNHRKKRRRLGATLVHWDESQSVQAALTTLASLHQGRMETSGRGG